MKNAKQNKFVRFGEEFVPQSDGIFFYDATTVDPTAIKAALTEAGTESGYCACCGDMVVGEYGEHFGVAMAAHAHQLDATLDIYIDHEFRKGPYLLQKARTQFVCDGCVKDRTPDQIAEAMLDELMHPHLMDTEDAR